MQDSNALLVQQFRENDETAFSKLVCRHYPLVFRVCLKILGHRQDAEDVTQETFSRFAKHVDRWDVRRPLEPWLVTIAGNRSKTFLARRRAHQSLTGMLEPISDEAHAIRKADGLREELQLALATVPEQQRLAFDLFHEQGMSYLQISAEMDCPVGTVKTWVHRARCRVVRILREREVIATAEAPLGRERQNSGELSARDSLAHQMLKLRRSSDAM
ncbi:sigma-70 family RNA polymerase sigma factor [Rubripirellula sp.]|jgi:RNA polymerase sigma-70 factor, ECF subfamily|nr:sigma-70 family RNA polymerase sigma factor [Rubripirellula sp.]MDB4634660.1 sigma-70 family RNA polymerase sigma factor [Rubripirellula sp.]MDC0288798.1 sigma-70 family RNA polymerase sigma factor [Rubripirellula sp.]